MKKTSPLVLALLSDTPTVRREPVPVPEPIRKDVTIYTGGATATDAEALQTCAPAAAVAILENAAKQRAVVEQFDEASVVETAIAAAALGLETLTSPCRVRLFTKCRQLVYAMQGSVRMAGYHDQMSRLQRAIRRGRHEVEWAVETTGYDQALLAVAYGAAFKLAYLETTEEAALTALALETTAQAARVKETGCAPPPTNIRPRFSLWITMRRTFGSVRRRIRDSLTTNPGVPARQHRGTS